MTLRLAIQPDEVLHRNGERQSYSRRWTALAREAGIDVLTVDVFADDAIAAISGCDAFMWRPPPTARERAYAKRLVLAIEQGLGMPVFPSAKTVWHFEDKIAQHYLLSLAGIRVPNAHVFWNKAQAVAYCRSAAYPLVLKLAAGYQSANVARLDDADAALYYVEQLFGPGLRGLGYQPASKPRRALRRLRRAAEILRGNNPDSPTPDAEIHHGYFYVQEFLPDNAFDTRVTIIGDRAFAFRRFNRPGDFRASGSGRLDWDPNAIDQAVLRMAFDIAGRLDVQTVAVDILRKNAAPVVVELTLTYASWAVRDCPGHWVLAGDPATGTLAWQAGQLAAEDAIFADFLACLRRAHG